MKNMTERSLLLSKLSFEKNPLAVFWVDAQARIDWVNPAACRYLGYTEAELTSMTIHDVDPDYTKDIWPRHWEEVKSKHVLTFETRLRTNDGNIIPVEVTANSAQLEGREFHLSFAQDISRQKRTEETLRNALAELEKLKDRLKTEDNYLREVIGNVQYSNPIIGRSDQLKRTLRKVEQVAVTNTTVLIRGETGTGKELIAHAIHNLSSRREKPFVKVNCAALPGHLIESELFGYEKGAFTGAFSRKIGRFELADGGTILLDEIGELPVELQAKLLRVLDNGEFERLGNPRPIKVDVRVIAITNRNLEKAIDAGNFRQDLYYRLNVFPIVIPPLRDRKQDIPLLAEYLATTFSTRIGKNKLTIPKYVMDALLAYSWPGNVRELSNVIESALISSQGETISINHLPQHILSRALVSLPERQFTGTWGLNAIERNAIMECLKQANWNKAEAARLLGITRSTLQSKIQKHGINKDNQ